MVNDRVWLAQSVIVVQDEAQETILLLLPGAQCAYPEGYWRWRKGDYTQGNRWQEARNPSLTLRQFTWQTNRILMFLEPDKYFSCWLFWDHVTDAFNCYYVNFQLPYRRSRIGFDTFDLELDLVIDAHLGWHWKDEDEYLTGIQAGEITREWVRGIEEAKAEVFNRIRHRHHPFNGSWFNWKLEATRIPNLPDGWQSV